MVSSFLERLLDGETKALATLVLFIIIAFAVIRYFQEIIRPYKGMFRLLYTVGVILLLYGLFAAPERVGQVFSLAVDWISHGIGKMFGEENGAYSD